MQPPKRRWLGLARPSRAQINTSVWINGAAATVDCVSIPVLREAAQDGTIFPFTCGCGDAGCAGYLKGVHVMHAGSEKLWVDQDAGAQYVFATLAFQAELAQIERVIAEAIARWPDLVIDVCE